MTAPRASLDALSRAPATRFAPAPTGLLHLGHVVNAIYTWGLARAAGGSVLLRIEDHDRQRSRRELEVALLEDLAWLGFVPDRPPLRELAGGGRSAFRQSDAADAYAAALATLRTHVHVYACDCSRSTFERLARATGAPWRGPGCPRGCGSRRLPDGPGRSLRAALGDGLERWPDVLAGDQQAEVAQAGDLVVRDRLGNWTYAFAVVVDDLRHAVDLVVRGRDLVADTARQIRLGRVLGRPQPPAFAHHPLALRDDGSKLSKSTGDTGVRELRAAGWSAGRVIGAAAAAVELVAPEVDLDADDAAALVVDDRARRAERSDPRSATMA